jgi:hypothetical protein
LRHHHQQIKLRYLKSSGGAELTNEVLLKFMLGVEDVNGDSAEKLIGIPPPATGAGGSGFDANPEEGANTEEGAVETAETAGAGLHRLQPSP